MIARIRTYRPSGSGHGWKDMDSYGQRDDGGGDTPPVQAALSFLDNMEPGDVYSIIHGDYYITIYYRREK